MSSPFERALREQLMAAARRPEPARQRVRPRVIAAVAAAVAALVAALTVLLPSPAAADVRVRIKDGVVEVTLTDLQTTPHEVQRAMNKAGLRSRIVGVPVGPSNLGRFVQVNVEGADTADIKHLTPSGRGFLGFTIPQGWPGTLVVELGRKAESGEEYRLSSDAFAKGEPLACSTVLGGRLGQVMDALTGIDVRIQPVSSELVAPEPLSVAMAEGRATWTVTAGDATSRHEVVLHVTEVAPSETPSASC